MLVVNVKNKNVQGAIYFNRRITNTKNRFKSGVTQGLSLGFLASHCSVIRMITFSDLGKKEFQELDTLASREYLKEHYKAQITSQKNSIYLH